MNNTYTDKRKLQKIMKCIYLKNKEGQSDYMLQNFKMQM